MLNTCLMPWGRIRGYAKLYENMRAVRVVFNCVGRSNHGAWLRSETYAVVLRKE